MRSRVPNCALRYVDYPRNRVDQPQKSRPFSGVLAAVAGENVGLLDPRSLDVRHIMSAFHREKVLSVQHWTDTLFSFTATRDTGFRFQNGQFAMIGLEVDGRPLMRAYSMASANHEEELEFFSIKVADGPLTSRLQKIKEGDTILVGRKATGTLITDNLMPGKRLLLLSTGTGLAPFVSLIKDPDVYEPSRASCWSTAAARSRNWPMASTGREAARRRAVRADGRRTS